MNSKRKSSKKTGEATNGVDEVIKRKKYRNLSLNPVLEESTDDFRKCWQQKKCFSKSVNSSKDSEIELYDSPFQLCVVKNLLKDDDEFLEELKDELSDLEYATKNNDLYQFHQSQELAQVDTPAVAALRELLYRDVVGWVREATGLPLNDKVDITCSRYDHTDVLLCHDDQTEGRKVAFILYLSHNWNKADGGTLDMFDRDEKEQPKDVVRSFVPTWNSFIFFEVTDKSFHQVSEVLTEDKTRVTVGGWFHAPSEGPLVLYKEPPTPCIHPIDSEVDLAKWINVSYLLDDTHRDINKFFEEHSEIRLTKFFVPEKFQEVSEALKSADMQWVFRGPANRRRYERALPSTSTPPAPECVWELLELLQSQQMFELLAAMTDLDLSDMEPDKVGSPRCHGEVQRWGPGCYTLLHNETGGTEHALEMMVNLNCDALTQEGGGYTSYIAKDDGEELLSVQPSSNSVSLTYKDKDTLGFVKYINQRFTSSFHTILMTYYERPSSESTPSPTPPS